MANNSSDDDLPDDPVERAAALRKKRGNPTPPDNFRGGGYSGPVRCPLCRDEVTDLPNHLASGCEQHKVGADYSRPRDADLLERTTMVLAYLLDARNDPDDPAAVVREAQNNLAEWQDRGESRD